MPLKVDIRRFNRVPDLTNVQVRKLAKANTVGSALIALNAFGWGITWVMVGYNELALLCFLYLFHAFLIYRANRRGNFLTGSVLMLSGLALWLLLLAFIVSGPGRGYGGAVHYYFITLAVGSHYLLRSVTWWRCTSIALSLFAFLFFEAPLYAFRPLVELNYPLNRIAEVFTWFASLATTLFLVYWLRYDFTLLDRKLRYRHDATLTVMSDGNAHSNNLSTLLSPDRTVKLFPRSAWLSIDVINMDELIRTYPEQILALRLNALLEAWDEVLNEEGVERCRKSLSIFSVISVGEHHQSEQTNRLLRLIVPVLSKTTTIPEVRLKMHIHSGALNVVYDTETMYMLDFWGEITRSEATHYYYVDSHLIGLDDATLYVARPQIKMLNLIWQAA